ncbi:hypothetical protein B0T14DRAFT_519516 [Immersiella caudata]|uniref:DUF7730 domain-containing protein n=1 Tax=Immersiella caudata TaxID=314043 RepID=A0AA40BZC2_9PEZI|nr:hypothetical protein B0T14DRAFT_519516 [Immersiella caudata]
MKTCCRSRLFALLFQISLFVPRLFPLLTHFWTGTSMAKRRPTLSVVELEEELGFQLSQLEVDLSSPAPTGANRLFSNFRPVSTDGIERITKEHEEFLREKRAKRTQSITLRQGESETVQVVDHNHSDFVRLHVRHDHGPGSYRFPVDIHYGFGLNLAFLFSEHEAARVLSTTKLHKRLAMSSTSTPAATTFLSLLPLEIRQSIYKFALAQGVWRMVDDEEFGRDNFPRSIGDPSGFYYPLGKPLSILRVNKQIRKEALPLAYRRTTFCLDSLESATRFLISVGQIGRKNIETLRVAWESTSEPTCTWATAAWSDQALEQLPGKLPSHTVSICIQLLKRCKRLRHLSVQFDSDLVKGMGLDAFRADAGVQGLCTLEGLKTVEIQELGMGPLGSDITRWLEGKMKGASKEEEECNGG